MKRRAFISLLGGAAAWPLAARAQQPDRVRRIGVLMSGAENDRETQARIKAFRQGLEALGWAEGRNIQIEYRFAGGDADRVQNYVAALVDAAPDLIVANGSSVLATLKQATRTIPIVFAVVNDPLGQGFVVSLAHPGANITGFTNIEFELRKVGGLAQGTRPAHQSDDVAVQSCDRPVLLLSCAEIRGRGVQAGDRADGCAGAQSG
jgi:putative tryptophan/tyrosine transport system substrate-binding protein